MLLDAIPNFKLDNRVGVVLVTDDEHTPISQLGIVSAVLIVLGRNNLGATALEGVGYWHPTREKERCIQVFTNYDEESVRDKVLDALLPLVTTWAEETEQESVAFIDNEGLLIVETEDLVQLSHVIREPV